MSHNEKWERRFLQLARQIAQWSKDPSTKVGAVIVRPDRTVASLGFNGFPRRTSDLPELYQDREAKYARVVHAEMNAVLSAHEPVRGYSLYCTHPVCERCAVHLIQAGIASVVWPASGGGGFSARWSESTDNAVAMLAQARVLVCEREVPDV